MLLQGGTVFGKGLADTARPEWKDVVSSSQKFRTFLPNGPIWWVATVPMTSTQVSAINEHPTTSQWITDGDLKLENCQHVTWQAHLSSWGLVRDLPSE